MYQSLDVFAITSYQEGLGISGLEAMACGVPVVSTRCGGPEDFVENGVTGFISSNTPTEFADNVGQLLKNTANYEQISRECRNIVRRNYSISVFSNAFEQAWKSAWGDGYRNNDLFNSSLS